MTSIELIRASNREQERRGNLPRSIAKRETCLLTFARWLAPMSLVDADRGDVERFLDSRTIGATTRYAYLSHLHCFYEWAIEEGHATSDPTAKIVRPKMRRRLPRPAATDDLAHALEVGSPRLRCWIALAAYQGLRCQEIAGLRVEDVIVADELLRVVHGKGAHERLLPLHPEVLRTLKALPLPRTGWAFVRPNGGRYSPVNVSVAFNKELREAGADVTAHQLRHWFATNLYGATHDLRLTQEMLGHASPATTAIYTQFDRRAAAVAVSGLAIGPSFRTVLREPA